MKNRTDKKVKTKLTENKNKVDKKIETNLAKNENKSHKKIKSQDIREILEGRMNNQDKVDLDNTSQISEEVYEREDSEEGSTRNALEISLLRASRKYDTFANMLLGNFDQNGKYIIDKEILQELMETKKGVYGKNEQGTLLRGAYKDGSSFEFLISNPEIDAEKNIGTSTLYIRETILKVNGYIQIGRAHV